MYKKGDLAHVFVVHSVDPKGLFASIPTSIDEGFWIVFMHGDDRNISQSVAEYVGSRKGILLNIFENRGLARSWNDAIAMSTEYGCRDFLILNDDLFFYEGGYNKLMGFYHQTINGNAPYGIITALGRETGNSPLAGTDQPQSFACSVLTRHAISRVGYFDENFFPAYFEDSDYVARMKRSHLETALLKEVIIEHARSSSLRASDKIRDQYSLHWKRNEEYYNSKWGGGLSKNGEYSYPFNDPSANLFISSTNRREPYVRQKLP